ncbi:MAG: FecR family protein [Candidatus Cyclobacteriaceae bacterium M3_2C_046]
MNLNDDLYEFLIADEFFINVVKKRPEEEWLKMMKKYPQDVETLMEARSFIESLAFKVDQLELNRIESIKNRIEDNIDIHDNQQSLRRFEMNPWIRRAASFILIISFAFALTWFLHNPAKQAISETQIIQKSTHKGQRMTTNLPDGTVVKLNASSTLRYELPFTADTRKVYLQGEAFFEVEEDTLRPFIVMANEVSTVVVGTSFNIKNRPKEEIEVALVTGKVKVLRNDNELYLLPGEMAVSKENKLQLNTYDYAEQIGWKDKILVFKNAELGEIIEKLSLWYGVDFHLKNQIPEVLYEGRFDNAVLTEVLDGLAFVYNFDYKVIGNKVELRFKPNPGAYE